MAYRKPNDLDGFMDLMVKTDMRIKSQLADDLVVYISDDTNSIQCTDMGVLIDGMLTWMSGSHFKIAQKSLESLSQLVRRMGSDFNTYTATVLPPVIDRLGDSHDTVREKAQLLLRDMMEHKVLAPQALLDKLAAICFKHKNAKVREEFLQTIVNTFNEYGTQNLTVRNYVRSICMLMGDPTVAVREMSVQTMVEIYKHLGERLRVGLRRIDDLPAAKLALLEQKFDQVKAEGLLLESAFRGTANGNGNGYDESDNISARDRPTKIVKRQLHSATSISQRQKSSIPDVSTDAGAVTMEIFEASFEIVPQLTIFHAKDMDDIYKQIMQIISDKNADWEKRIDALKKIRALLMLNIQAQAQFVAVQLKELSISFLDILKEELRSQVIREACITIAYMSKTMRNKLDVFCWSILEQLIQLIQNSAKVIASASTLAMKYVIKYTHSPKLIRIMTDTLNQSKSKDIRAALCEMLVLLFEEWPTKALEKHSIVLRDTLKKSIGDADSEARRHSRCAYWLFRRHFPELADQIYGNLDINAQRALERERDGGSSGGAGGFGAGTSSQAGAEGRRSIARMARSPSSLQKPAAGMRSVSAVDPAAAQRARTRAQYSLYARQKKPLAGNSQLSTPGGTGSLPRSRLGSNVCVASGSAQSGAASTMSTRSRGRSGVSQSQPSSRSTSPSTKLRDQYGLGTGAPYYRHPGTTGAIPKRASGIPRSTASSRETSPTRLGSASGSNLMKRSIYSTRRTPERLVAGGRPTAAARLLAQSREAEYTLGDAHSPVDGQQQMMDYTSGDYMRNAGGMRMGRKLLGRDESDDIDSEASECSERSFDSSYTRGNNSSYSLSGSRNRLDWSSSQRAPIEDIETIIQYCASTHWSERKDGLVSLTQYLTDGKALTAQQLQCVLDMFRKMFMDTHTKVYSLFLDTVTEVVLAYSPQLHDWLFILLTRLFNKLGTDLLNSMHGKIWKTLQIVNECFPPSLQLKEMFRIISDSTQTPTTKTRIAILRFLTELAVSYATSKDFPTEPSAACERTVLKLTQLASDQKSIELRSQARHCMVSLYNLNMSQMTKLLSSLPKNLQDTARLCIQSHIRRQSTNSGTNSPSSSPLSSSSPKPLQSPLVNAFTSLQLHDNSCNNANNNNVNNNTSPRSRQSSVEQELLYANDLDIKHNIQKTTEEIRNCFGGVVAEPVLQARQYHSLASANGHNGHMQPAEQQQQQLQQQQTQVDSCASVSSNSKTQSSANTTESNTPESATMRLELLGEGNHHSKLTSTGLKTSPSTHNTNATNVDSGSGSTSSKVYVSYDTAENGEVVLEPDLHESDIVHTALTLNKDMPAEQLETALSNLGVCIRAGNCELPNKNFRGIMRMLLNLLESDQIDVLMVALNVLSKILRSEKMSQNWMNFLELILLKIINCYQHSKDAMREIDSMIPRIAPALPLDLSINIVNPVIATGAFPANLCAIKMLLELTERHGDKMTDAHLDAVFPNLARSTDDVQSMVRKAAVFCIVKLYVVLGEEKVRPKLSVLMPSKLRLLNVYIEKQRASGSSGSGSSARNSSGNSS